MLENAEMDRYFSNTSSYELPDPAPDTGRKFRIRIRQKRSRSGSATLPTYTKKERQQQRREEKWVSIQLGRTRWRYVWKESSEKQKKYMMGGRGGGSERNFTEINISATPPPCFLEALGCGVDACLLRRKLYGLRKQWTQLAAYEEQAGTKSI